MRCLTLRMPAHFAKCPSVFVREHIFSGMKRSSLYVSKRQVAGFLCRNHFSLGRFVGVQAMKVPDLKISQTCRRRLRKNR